MSILINTWKSPSLCINYNNKEWELLIRQARASYMLARLATKLLPYYDKGQIKEKIWLHFSSASIVANRQRENTLVELENIESLLSRVSQRAIILKGAAYSAQNLTVAQGRTFNDIDILVEQESIETIENQLWLIGFIPIKEDDYDKLYYRKWMHEIPPLRHIKRKTVLDVHHNILPLTCETKVNIDKLKENTSPLSHFKNLSILSDEALILHSATHLFHEGEFDKALRDLIDLNLLLVQYIKNKQSIKQLLKISNDTGLGQQLFYAIRYVNKLSPLNVSAGEMSALNKYSPGQCKVRILDFCFSAIFTPNHSSCATWKKSLAALILYWRGHLLRMPLRLLTPHLVRKFIMRLRDSFTSSVA